jgi:uncharacterized damage-inducible protein DinB
MPAYHIRRLLDHMWWADARVGESLERATEVPARAVELYAHLLGTELRWLDRIEAVESSVAVWPAASVAECRGLARMSQERYEGAVGALSASDLLRSVRYTNSAGRQFTSRIEDILLHVALHGAYHRGQVALLLRDAGAEPRLTDFIQFVRGEPAATRDAAG